MDKYHTQIFKQLISSNSFINQTAKDYDLDYETVLDIWIKNPDNFYKKLEEYIKPRKD